MIVLTLLVQGCAKKQIEYVYVKPEIPKQFLEKETIKIRTVKTQSEAAVLILDLYEGLEKCNLKLEKIKAINE